METITNENGHSYRETVVDIMGTPYTVRFTTQTESPELAEMHGCEDKSAKLIKIRTPEDYPKTPHRLANFEVFPKHIVRHEVIHAYLDECGLQDQCHFASEEAVDWLACLIPRIVKTMTELEAME